MVGGGSGVRDSSLGATEFVSSLASFMPRHISPPPSSCLCQPGWFEHLRLHKQFPQSRCAFTHSQLFVAQVENRVQLQHAPHSCSTRNLALFDRLDSGLTRYLVIAVELFWASPVSSSRASRVRTTIRPT